MGINDGLFDKLKKELQKLEDGHGKIEIVRVETGGFTDIIVTNRTRFYDPKEHTNDRQK